MKKTSAPYQIMKELNFDGVCFATVAYFVGLLGWMDQLGTAKSD